MYINCDKFIVDVSRNANMELTSIPRGILRSLVYWTVLITSDLSLLLALRHTSFGEVTKKNQ